MFVFVLRVCCVCVVLCIVCVEFGGVALCLWYVACCVLCGVALRVLCRGSAVFVLCCVLRLCYARVFVCCACVSLCVLCALCGVCCACCVGGLWSCMGLCLWLCSWLGL